MSVTNNAKHLDEYVEVRRPIVVHNRDGTVTRLTCAEDRARFANKLAKVRQFIQREAS